MDIKSFVKGALERALKTAAQVFATLIAAGQFDILTFDWVTTGQLVASAFVASLVTSLANPTFVEGSKPENGGAVDPSDVGEGTVPDTDVVEDEPEDVVDEPDADLEDPVV